MSFASRHIQGSQKRTAATILFTPCVRQHHPVQVPAHQQPPSPTPQPAKPPLSLSSSSSPSGSESEDEVRVGLKRLQLKPRSGSQSPRAGPHSKQHGIASRPKGGAKDVWTFFEKSSVRHICILCKCVKDLPHSHAEN